MLFCKECGAQLKEGAAFCPSCGTNVKTHESERIDQTRQQIAPAKKMSKKKKLVIAGISAAVVILFGAYKVGEHFTDKNRKIENFEMALIEGNTENVAKLLNTNDPQLKISETTVKGFVDYYKKHPNEVNELINNLQDQSTYIDNNTNKKSTSSFFSEDDLKNGVVNLKKDGKTWLFYDNYTLEVEEVYVSISTNYKNTQLSIAGKEIGKADKKNFEQTYGPFLPGIYKVEAKLKTDFVDLKKKREVTLIDVGSKVNIDMYLEGEEVTVDMESFDPTIKAELFIDGKDVKINPNENPTFGPVLTDGSMKLNVEATLPWGKVKTNEIPISSSEVEINLGQSKDLQETIFNQVVSYSKEALEAYTSGSADKVTTATNRNKEDILERIEYLQYREEYYKGQYLGTTFAIDSLNVEYNGEQWEAEVEVLQTYNEAEYYEGETPQLEKNEVNRVYTLVYNEENKKWLIETMDYSYGYGTDNVKEINEKEPKTYQTSWGNSKITDDKSQQIASFVEEYMYASVDAINAENFSIVEPYLDSSGKKYNEQKEYTAYLNEKGITEELLNIEIKEVKKLDDTTYQVTSLDEYKLMYSDGTDKTTSFKTVQKVKIQSDGSFAMNELISTDEQ
ncbi:zinc ribbon domain-containing protein [Metabacillus malikii]|uniref:Membrane protein YvbJ n=1 Tax=Metabacillus malikii TaxID=1504265 RepID=A0ABT9ZAQ1_9BACI|nr:zinc-ribbon domain-containing protein [Metabacillus malikii]MDQ0229292.1 putative membrane protein YvbJ [Metabacillus malikii]